jgi:hypothetical protein
MSDTITDFGNGRDVLDVSRLLDRVDAPADPFASGFLDLEIQNGSTLVRFDQNGGGDNFVVLTTLQDVVLTNSSTSLVI